MELEAPGPCPLNDTRVLLECPDPTVLETVITHDSFDVIATCEPSVAYEKAVVDRHAHFMP